MAVALVSSTAACGGDTTTVHRVEARVGGEDASLRLNNFTVSVPATATAGSILTVVDDVPADQSVLSSQPSWLTPLSPTVQIVLDNGNQPTAPIALSYQLPLDVHVPKDSIPVVVSRSADGSYDLVEARVEEPNTLSADLQHLSWDVFAWLNLAEFDKQVSNVVKSALGTGGPRPDCVGTPREYANLTTTISAVQNDVAWTCLLMTPGSNRVEPSESVQLRANSPYAWVLANEPQPLTINVAGTDGENKTLRSVYKSIAGNRAILAPGETVRMDFGQYEQGPRSGTLARDKELDKTATTAWAYGKALEMAGFGTALDTALQMVKCAGIDTSSPATVAKTGSECLQGFSRKLIQIVLAKAAVQWISEIAAQIDGPGPTSVTWTVSSQTGTEIGSGGTSGTGSGPVVLGRADNQYSIGYGTERPETLSLNSLCANTISGITWTSWGGPTAEGTGDVCAPAGDPSSGGPARLTATDLGSCGGELAYRTLLIDGRPGFDVCTD